MEASIMGITPAAARRSDYEDLSRMVGRLDLSDSQSRWTRGSASGIPVHGFTEEVRPVIAENELLFNWAQNAISESFRTGQETSSRSWSSHQTWRTLASEQILESRGSSHEVWRTREVTRILESPGNQHTVTWKRKRRSARALGGPLNTLYKKRSKVSSRH